MNRPATDRVTFFADAFSPPTPSGQLADRVKNNYARPFSRERRRVQASTCVIVVPCDGCGHQGEDEWMSVTEETINVSSPFIFCQLSVNRASKNDRGLYVAGIDSVVSP